MNKSDDTNEEFNDCRKDGGCIYLLCCISFFMIGFSIFTISLSLNLSCDKWETKYRGFKCVETAMDNNNHCNNTICSCTRYINDDQYDTICIDNLETKYNKFGIVFGCIFAVIAIGLLIEPLRLLIKCIHYKIRKWHRKYQHRQTEKVRLLQLYTN